jgi:hypothetical protein
VLLCWSENAQLSGERRKVLKDSRVMISGELSSLVAYLVKSVKRSLESEVDLRITRGQRPKKTIEKDATPAAAPA